MRRLLHRVFRSHVRVLLYALHNFARVDLRGSAEFVCVCNSTMKNEKEDVNETSNNNFWQMFKHPDTSGPFVTVISVRYRSRKK